MKNPTLESVASLLNTVSWTSYAMLPAGVSVNGAASQLQPMLQLVEEIADMEANPCHDEVRELVVRAALAQATNVLREASRLAGEAARAGK